MGRLPQAALNKLAWGGASGQVFPPLGRDVAGGGLASSVHQASEKPSSYSLLVQGSKGEVRTCQSTPGKRTGLARELDPLSARNLVPAHLNRGKGQTHAFSSHSPVGTGALLDPRPWKSYVQVAAPGPSYWKLGSGWLQKGA